VQSDTVANHRYDEDAEAIHRQLQIHRQTVCSRCSKSYCVTCWEVCPRCSSQWQQDLVALVRKVCGLSLTEAIMLL